MVDKDVRVRTLAVEALLGGVSLRSWQGKLTWGSRRRPPSVPSVGVVSAMVSWSRLLMSEVTCGTRMLNCRSNPTIVNYEISTFGVTC